MEPAPFQVLWVWFVILGRYDKLGRLGKYMSNSSDLVSMANSEDWMGMSNSSDWANMDNSGDWVGMSN